MLLVYECQWIVLDFICTTLSSSLHLKGMILKCRLLEIYFHLRGMTRNSEIDKTETDVRRMFGFVLTVVQDTFVLFFCCRES